MNYSISSSILSPMVLKTATYTGMNLKGEIRESISLDEDDLSDVEDEVFIRDGKNGYKFAEEMNVKRPLMAPRRRLGKHDAGSRIKPRNSCRIWCRPCCYILAALSILIGLIVLVVVLVSIYPLPLDKLRDWVISKSKSPTTNGRLPCITLKVTDVWAINLPAFTTDSPVRALDIDGDGVDDVLFGFGTGDNNNIVPPDIYCPIYLGVPAPCDGGVIALNGVDGSILWRHWMNDTMFNLHCSADVNLDGLNDCLAVGVDGTIAMINARTGNGIWTLNTGKMNVFVANFIPDQDGDNISDIISSHSSLNEKSGGHIIILSGKNGQEVKRVSTPKGAKTFYMPQLLRRNETSTVLLYGTGSPSSPGNLSAVTFRELNNLANDSHTLYEDKFKGILTQSVLVDITGDNVPDVISSFYNSSIIAINGASFQQIWNYSIANAVTDMSPTPAYFNSDNVTDFMVIYQKYDSIFNYNYTQTLIIDGVTGRPIYQPLSGGVITQMNGLTLSMDGRGHDLYLYWTSDCSSTDGTVRKISNVKTNDECKRQYNSTTILKLNALNEYIQPPGIVVYTSALRTDFEYNNTKSASRILREYIRAHPSPPIPPIRGQAEIPKVYSGDPGDISIRKYGKSNFRHKDRPSGIVKDFNPESQALPDDYNIWMPNDDVDPDFNYDNLGYNQKIFDEVAPKIDDLNDRDPRSKEKGVVEDERGKVKTKKKNLADKIYGYHNVRLAKNRLLHDEEALPTDILKDTYFKNEENRLKKAKFEQRDVNSHLVGAIDDSDVKKIIEEQKNSVLNHSTTLWDIETESEMGEREDQNYQRRKKRNVDAVWDSLNRVTSVGAVLGSFNVSNETNTIDVVFVKYWQPADTSLQDFMDKDIDECVMNKRATIQTESEQKSLFQKECQDEQDNMRRDFAFFNQLSQLKLGQMTVYRIRIQCECDSIYNKKIKGTCANFLPKTLQGWPEYLGRNGDGVFMRN